jgi:hypothetical protein
LLFTLVAINENLSILSGKCFSNGALLIILGIIFDDLYNKNLWSAVISILRRICAKLNDKKSWSFQNIYPKE